MPAYGGKLFEEVIAYSTIAGTDPFFDPFFFFFRRLTATTHLTVCKRSVIQTEIDQAGLAAYCFDERAQAQIAGTSRDPVVTLSEVLSRRRPRLKSRSLFPQ